MQMSALSLTTIDTTTQMHPLAHYIPVLRSVNRLPYSADHLYDAGGYLGNAGGYLHAAADHLWRHVSDETEARAI